MLPVCHWELLGDIKKEKQYFRLANTHSCQVFDFGDCQVIRLAVCVAQGYWSNFSVKAAGILIKMHTTYVFQVFISANKCVCARVCPAMQVHGIRKGERMQSTCKVLCCNEAVGGRGGSAVEIIPSFFPKSCARWADQGLWEEWYYPVAVTQPLSLPPDQPGSLAAYRPGHSAFSFDLELQNNYG